ncbi:CgeB family protein [Steroidobacter cummioxidans]|uniref:CgeB family protein n=1 Tax=Steroidobacter cummioxidans TaxID=1803913 RepID=UPI000E31850B|nr:glycosyltransferase [Steroidobacter cummioxidans]
MKFVLFYHSLISDWNHGNAHFLRGVVSELLHRGYEVQVYEPESGWSLTNLRREQGERGVADFHAAFPELSSTAFDAALDVDAVLDGADVLIVHEWNEPRLIQRLGESASQRGCTALFHDTHHRSVTDASAMSALDLRHYDGVLAFGQAVADQYTRHGWAAHSWVWHEAADLRRFTPLPASDDRADLVWIGNWGDDERSAELHEYLIEPVRQLSLQATVHGVRYPEHALKTLHEAGIGYRGWLPNHRVPEVFARHRCTVHVPRQTYARQLHGIPTIRMFEALACGIPLVTAPWHDSENLFRPGVDYLVATRGEEMQRHLWTILNDAGLAASLAHHGLETIRARHSCAHRVDELLQILTTLQTAPLRRSAGGSL